MPDSQGGKQQQQGAGVAMLVAGFLLALAMLTWVMGGLEQQRHNPNQRPQGNMVNHGADKYMEVNLKRNQWNQYLVNGTINGLPVVFLVDTGANVISIPAGLERRLNLIRGRLGYAHTANGTATIYDTTLKQIAVAGIVRENMRASIVESMGGEQVLLGMNFLSTMELQQTADTLTLRERL
ncbi:MAG: retropepsin-like aspartic protease family protein [Candidatus Porifericomitaceae bacterium WSBS_2022_MAG_OTU9]